MGKNYLICFIGIDGTGKTTLARMLAQEMNQNNINTKYVIGRFETFKLLKPALFVIKKTLSLFGRRTDQSAEGLRTKRSMFKNRFLAKIWQLSMFLDYLLQLGYKIGLPLMLGRSISCDRYIYDTAVDTTTDFGLSVPKMKESLENMLHLAPKPNVVFLIDLPEEFASQRNLAKSDNLSLDYLRERRELYLNFRGRSEVEVLDGSKKPDELLAIINDTLRARKILK